MKKTLKSNVSPILNHTPYVGSVRNKIIHSTSNSCQEACTIPPDERWYISVIPSDGNYTKCPECFPIPEKRYED